jgi:hypothetical protein
VAQPVWCSGNVACRSASTTKTMFMTGQIFFIYFGQSRDTFHFPSLPVIATRERVGGCCRWSPRDSQLLMSDNRILVFATIALDWSGRAKARSGLRMMPTFPLPSLKFRTAGFPQYGFKAGRSDKAFPFDASLRRTVCHCPSCSPLPSSDPRSVPGDVARWSTSVRAAAAALPQGPSLQTGLFCPAPSSLAAPSAPLAGTSRFHRSAAYTKCLRCAHCA